MLTTGRDPGFNLKNYINKENNRPI